MISANRRTRAVVLLVGLIGAAVVGCRKAPPEPPAKGTREDFYAMVPVSAQYRTARLAIQLVSDSVTLTLDSASVRGIDQVVDTWRRLWQGANITSVSRTVRATRTDTSGMLRDSGTVVFGRRAQRDTTMRFVTWWRAEREGWRIYLDSIRSWP